MLTFNTMKITGDSINERIEKFLSWKDKLPTYTKRGVALNKKDNITAVKGTFESDNTLHKEWIFTHNLVTSEGDIYYAKKITLKKGDGTTYSDTDFGTDGILFHHDGVTSVNGSILKGCMILGRASTTPHENDRYGVSGISGTTFSSGAYSASTAINTTKVLRSYYPRFDDNDADNTGGATDQVTWSYNWATADFDTSGNPNITGGVIVDRAGNATPASGAKLLCHFNFPSSFEKTANDTLKIFVNHTFEGN